MKGIVKIIKNGSPLEESPNMILDGMGQVLAEAMMVSPSLSSISSASALLDTSNYTIQAISFGKDARGYVNHAHNPPDSVSAQTIIDHIVRVEVPTSYTTSSYITSDVNTYSNSVATGRGLDVATSGETYNLLPEYSNPNQTRLEQKFFGLAVDVSSEVGHNLNKLDVSGGFSNRELYGCYPDASGTKYYLLSNWDNLNTPIGQVLDAGASGTAYSLFNSVSSMDRDGFVKMSVSSANEADKLGASVDYGSHSGMVVWASGSVANHIQTNTGFSSTGKVQYITTVSGGDLLFAGLFGGIYTLGLWAIDIKESIRNGINAPFPFNYLDNKIKYKLVARKTFTKDLTFVQDYSTSSGYKFLENKVNGDNTDNNHLLIKWELQF